MGTQRSSDGPGSNVPLIPSWVLPVEAWPDTTIEDTANEEQEATNKEEQKKQDVAEAPRLATPLADLPVLAQIGRFRGARLHLGRYARTGTRKELETGLGNYVRSGLGGAAQGARRMAGTSRVAGNLIGGFHGFSAGESHPPEFGLDRAALAGRPAREVGDRITDAVCPIDGTQDAEARRDALSRAISETADQFIDLDMTALTSEQISFLLERFVAYDICHRIELDVGKAIFEKARDYAAAVTRIEEIRQYVREKIAASFRARAENGQKLTRSATAALTARVIQDTMEVFEDYVE